MDLKKSSCYVFFHEWNECKKYDTILGQSHFELRIDVFSQDSMLCYGRVFRYWVDFFYKFSPILHTKLTNLFWNMNEHKSAKFGLISSQKYNFWSSVHMRRWGEMQQMVEFSLIFLLFIFFAKLFGMCVSNIIFLSLKK